MAETAQVRLAYEVESIYGTAPTTNGARLVPLVSEDLKSQQSYQASNIIRGKNAVDSQLLTDSQGGGTVRTELLYDQFFIDMYRAAMAASAEGTKAQYAATGVHFSPGDTLSTYNQFSPLAPSSFPGVNVPDFVFVLVDGCDDELLNDIWCVYHNTTSLLEVLGKDPATLSSADHVNGKWLKGKTSRSSNVQFSYALEKQFQDLSGFAEFERLLGQIVQQAQIEVPQAGPITSSIQFLGKLPERTSAAFDATPTAFASNAVMLGSDKIKILMGDPTADPATAAASGFDAPIDEVQSVRLSWGPNPRLRKKVGLVGPYSFGLGDVVVQGEFTAVYADETQFERHISDTEIAIALTVKSGVLGYAFLMPECKITAAERLTPGRNQDIVARIAFEASLGVLGSNEFVLQFQHFDGVWS